MAYGNIDDRASLKGAFTGVSAVFHLAQPGTENVVDLCLELGISRLVHVSSVAAVGAAQHPANLLVESSPNTIRKHGFPNYEAKSRTEDLVLEACRTRGLDAVIVNPSVIVGAGDAQKEVCHELPGPMPCANCIPARRSTPRTEPPTTCRS